MFVQKIIKNMTESGTHTSDLHEFIEQAMQKVMNSLGFPEACYLCVVENFNNKLITPLLTSYMRIFEEVLVRN